MVRFIASATNVRTYSFEKGIEPDVKLINFWPPEDGFAWSTSTWCEVSFPSLPIGRGDNAIIEVALDLDAFKSPPDLDSQRVFIYLNGLRVVSREISKRLILLVEVAATQLQKGENVIVIDTPDAALPSDHGISDTRRLGVQVFSVTIRAGEATLSADSADWLDR